MNIFMTKHFSTTRRRLQAGFTLIELMVVLVIIGVLAALIVPNVLDRADDARATAAKTDVNNVMQALKLYRLDNQTLSSLLATGRHDVWDELSRRFESRLILTALSNTKGRRIEAAQKLGIGRNTITRKIQELGLE